MWSDAPPPAWTLPALAVGYLAAAVRRRERALGPEPLAERFGGRALVPGNRLQGRTEGVVLPVRTRQAALHAHRAPVPHSRHQGGTLPRLDRRSVHTRQLPPRAPLRPPGCGGTGPAQRNVLRRF